MYAICVEFDCLQGKREAFVERVTATGILDAVLAEDGCLRYEYFYSTANPNLLLLMEEWESKDHQQIHIKQPHMAELLAFKDEYINNTQLKEIIV